MEAALPGSGALYWGRGVGGHRVSGEYLRVEPSVAAGLLF